MYNLADVLEDMAVDILKFNGYKKPVLHKDWRKSTDEEYLYEHDKARIKNKLKNIHLNFDYDINLKDDVDMMVYLYLIFN